MSFKNFEGISWQFFVTKLHVSSRKSIWTTNVFLVEYTKSIVTEACGTTSFQKKQPKIRSNLTWQNEHALAKVPVKLQFLSSTKDQKQGRSPIWFNAELYQLHQAVKKAYKMKTEDFTPLKKMFKTRC